jgi:hypothetical protein
MNPMNLQYSRHLASDSNGIKFIAAFVSTVVVAVIFALAYCMFCRTPNLASKEDRGLDLDIDEEKDLPVPEIAKTISNGSQESLPITDPHLTSCDVHKCTSGNCGACNPKGQEITFLALGNDGVLELADVDERLKRKHEMETDQVFEL